jgi:hypothetical protein
MGKHFRALGGVVTVLAALALVAGAAGGGGPSFHAPVTLPGSNGGNEPSLAISTKGVRYASWQAPGQFARSSDGVNFTDLGQPDSGSEGDVTNAVDASGAVYNAQICGLPTILHTCVYRSLDGGQTWEQTSMLADTHPGASDRPWIDVYPHTSSGAWNPDNTTVYLEYHTFSPDDLAYVTVSHDGGHTFSTPTPVETGTNTLDSGCNTVPSGIVVDDATGNVYAAWLSGDNFASNLITGCNYSQLGPFDKAWVSTSTDGGTTWSSNLAWHGNYDVTTKIGDNADKIFGTVSVDRSGQVHVLLPVRRNDDPNGFATDCETNSACQETPQKTDLLLVSSPDQGAHWTQPFTVRTGGSNFFPWIAAGSVGNVDAVYYTSSTLLPNDPNSNWYIGFSQITGAKAALGAYGAYYPKLPKVTSLLLDKNVVHHGGICTFGIFCSVVPNSNRSLADSIAIALDPNGGANATWTNDASDPERIDFACQQGGTSAIAGKSLKGCYKAKS